MARDMLFNIYIYRETDKLFFFGIYPINFGNTQLFFKHWVTKSKIIIEYPIKIVDFV